MTPYFDFSSLDHLQVLTEASDSTVTINITSGRISVSIHDGLGLAFAKKFATSTSDWYGAPWPNQRHYEWEHDGIKFTAFEHRTQE